MKSWRERAKQDGVRFQFGMACCGVQTALVPRGETICLQCKKPASFDEVLAAHGLTRDDLPKDPVIGSRTHREDIPA